MLFSLPSLHQAIWDDFAVELSHDFRVLTVDLPGFGYARVPKALKSSWGEMVSSYLAKRQQLVLSVHIVDSRHAPTKLDLQLREWLEHSAKPRLIVATKSDKLSNNELKQTLGRIERVFPAERVIAYSAKTGRGRNEVWQEIETALAEFHQH